MKKNTLLPVITIIFAFILTGCAPSSFSVHRQATGPIKTNCYLLVDPASREAALIDVGGPIDTLVSLITENKLSLKYIFTTHGHIDHMEGLPELRQKFPEAKLCMNLKEYDAFLHSIEYSKTHSDPKKVAAIMQNPGTSRWLTYDLTTFGPPDLNVENEQIFKLGDLDIRAILSPGHSPTSMCYVAGKMVFSGDVLFYRRVGTTDGIGSSRDEIIVSVRRLYSSLPEETIVYPGHGQPTDIGTEKRENQRVTVDSVNFK